MLKKGSSGLAESYIQNEFETEDLSSLIELSARNIEITYKFSGFLQFFPYLKIFLIKIYSTNTKERSKKNISITL